jgi:hypothetical protein
MQLLNPDTVPPVIARSLAVPPVNATLLVFIIAMLPSCNPALAPAVVEPPVPPSAIANGANTSYRATSDVHSIGILLTHCGQSIGPVSYKSCGSNLCVAHSNCGSGRSGHTRECRTGFFTLHKCCGGNSV